MKIILREDVEKLGKAGEIVKVKDGYGRNYLIPRKLAVLANVRNMKALDHDRRTIETRAKKTRKTAEETAATLSAVSLTLPAKAGEEGKLFGAITSRDIAEALGKAGVTVDRKAIQLADPIKQVGDYKVKIRVATDVFPEISVSVVPEASAAFHKYGCIRTAASAPAALRSLTVLAQYASVATPCRMRRTALSVQRRIYDTQH